MYGESEKKTKAKAVRFVWSYPQKGQRGKNNTDINASCVSIRDASSWTLAVEGRQKN